MTCTDEAVCRGEVIVCPARSEDPRTSKATGLSRVNPEKYLELMNLITAKEEAAQCRDEARDLGLSESEWC